MTPAQLERLPDCFRRIVEIDRQRVVSFDDIRERREQRRYAEIFCLDRRLAPEGPGRPAAARGGALLQFG